MEQIEPIEEYALKSSGEEKHESDTFTKVGIVGCGILGQEIATLFEGKQTIGNHTITFNATNLPGGIYLYRLETKEFTETKKLILLK